MKTFLIAVVSATLTVEENERLDSFVKLEDLKCPTFVCDEKSFVNQVYCYKNNIDNPFEVKVKNCKDNYKISDSDFWGNPIPRNHDLYCHHEQNRCVRDPFSHVTGKKPGDRCIN